MNIFVTLLIIFTITIIPTLYLFKIPGIKNNDSKIKLLILYFFSCLIYILIFIVSSIIYLYNMKELDTCGTNCINYTNSLPNIIIGLLLYFIISNIFYFTFKNILLKYHYHNSKFKYIILITYILLIYCISIIGYYIYGGFLGKFIIDNLFVNIFRWFTIGEPFLIYPINIFLNITKKKLW